MLNLEVLNQLVTEFYDKMSSWEHSVVRETGYSLAQVHTIEVLGNHGHLRMKELANKLGITTGTLTVQVDKLVSANLIERLTDPEDGRAIVVSLTEEGQSIHQYHNQLHLNLMKELTRNISTEDGERLIAILSQMNKEF
ncbi:MarR family transcriptional regulator [Vibrio genomosp. F6]|uniref:MarR family winged helix-turn-helix transcriptional regulator n=1 Tax=Vibrio TaxID=662 RepID=UPI000DE90E69|nr:MULTISPECIES: MarR family transcriptional regulator [Vibrio]MDN3697522.1 MarR family transcriptional regulator [Vibrio cortegadensis]RBW64962.1 MarR family transcriptional regulator [Vibrionales bacterium C3R12]TKF24581.1 MarR family transcriptional regulator [Vibrio genomosp. F6]